MRTPIILTATILSAGSAAAQWPEPLNTALTKSASGPSYVFDVERTSTREGEDPETLKGYARVDLSAPEFKQITPAHLIDPDLPGSSFSALSGIEAALEDGLWCTRFAEDVPTDPEDIEILRENETSVTYGFKPVIPEDAEGPEKKIIRRTNAEITISKTDPAVLNYSRSLSKTVTVFVVAKIRQADSAVTCARAPDGRTYAQVVASEFEASGLGSGGNSSEMRITALYDPDSGEQLTPES